eukprot:m.41044 g.41044  ORF g.41044 m.41044 type:complete len:172 (+) comp10502_c0_seq2:191-706(+)
MASQTKEGGQDHYAIVEDDEFQQVVLERSLQQKVSIILIQNAELSSRVERTIQLGNMFHKTAVLAGLGSLLFHLSPIHYAKASLPLGAVSFTCASLYNFVWSKDSLYRYQLDKEGVELENCQGLPKGEFTVIFQREDGARKVLHNTMSLCAIGFCVWKAYKAGVFEALLSK